MIDTFNLTNRNEKVFLNAGLSSGKKIEEYSDSDLDLLDDKGFIFATSVAGIAGFFIVDTPTCTDNASDYKFVENNRTIKKRSSLHARLYCHA